MLDIRETFDVFKATAELSTSKRKTFDIKAASQHVAVKLQRGFDMARPRKGEEIKADATIGVRVSADLRGKLEAMAVRHKRSISEEVRAALEAYVRKQGKVRVEP
jgi:hypothetical protein